MEPNFQKRYDLDMIDPQIVLELGLLKLDRVICRSDLGKKACLHLISLTERWILFKLYLLHHSDTEKI